MEELSMILRCKNCGNTQFLVEKEKSCLICKNYISYVAEAIKRNPNALAGTLMRKIFYENVKSF